MASTSTIEEVFRGRIFKIPNYQRGYSWERNQWQDLKKDLELLPSLRNHFTGTLVLRLGMKQDGKIRDEEGRTYQVFDVIDGQQRLTTLVILLDVIRNEFATLGEEKLANGIREMYLWVRNKNGESIPRLRLNRDSQDFFLNNILGLNKNLEGVKIQSHKRLDECKGYYQEFLSDQKQADENYPIWLEKLYEKITAHLTFLVYEAENAMEAGIIFETMNDRGRPLTELDKVKNYLLYVAPKLDLEEDHKLVELVNETWTHIFENLMEVNLGNVTAEDNLLRYHWLMAYQPDTRRWQRSRTIKEYFDLAKYKDDHLKLYTDLKEYLVTLKNATTAFCDLEDPSRPHAFNEIKDKSIRNQVLLFSQKLKRMDVRAGLIPLLIAVRLQSQDGGITYLETLKLAEKFAFRVYFWIEYQSGAGQPRLFRIANSYYGHKNVERMLSELTWANLNYCNQAQFQERFNSETMNWYRWKGIRYLLYEYELYIAEGKKEHPGITWDALWDQKDKTIEHILPQDPSNPYWQERFTIEQLERWTKDIGNLTLTYDNSSLSNKSFDEKRGNADQEKCYASSKIFIEHELARYNDWNEASIVERREKIKAWAIERWKVIAPDPVDPEPEEEAPVWLRARGSRVHTEMMELHKLASEQKLFYLYYNKNSISYASKYNAIWKAMTVWPYKDHLWILIRPWWWTNYPNMTQDIMEEIFASKWEWWIHKDKVPEFIDRLARAFEVIRGENHRHK